MYDPGDDRVPMSLSGMLAVYSGMFSSVFLFKTLLQGLLW